MVSETLTSIIKSLDILTLLSEQPMLDVGDLESYNETELQAIDEFLQKSVASLGTFYKNQADLMEQLQKSSEGMEDTIEETTVEHVHEGEIEQIRKELEE